MLIQSRVNRYYLILQHGTILFHRGLVRVYELSSDWNNVYKYLYKLRDWKELRRAKETENNHEDFKDFRAKPLNKIVQSINSMTPESCSDENSEILPMDSDST